MIAKWVHRQPFCNHLYQHGSIRSGMTELFGDERPLPQFRKDLEIFEGPHEPDGSPTFNIYDPVRAQYFKITWAESLVVRHLKQGMTLANLYDAIEKETTLKVSKEQIKYFLLDSFRHDLLAVVKPSEHHEKMLKYKRPGFFKWLIFNYLYIRIPIVNPDSFLTRTIQYVRLLGSAPALLLYGLLSLVGIVILFTRFGEFVSTFPYFFNFQGIVTFALAISAVKFVHELSHAYAAKNFGVYVPSMGIVIIVLWPMLYTNVTDGWKLKRRSERFFISVAGIVAELIIAGLSTIGWLVTTPGLAHSVFFVLASVTWISTLVINLNPGIRFDGYYILGDLWGIDNLQLRAFAVTRWKLRELLLGIKALPPEERLTPRRTLGMIVYAICTWIYRVFLYTAIALILYFKFTKALGVFLFFLEIAIFLVWPIWSEVKALYLMRGQVNWNRHSFTTFIIVSSLVGWFVLPLPRIETFPAVTVASDQQVVYMPHASIVKEIHVARDDAVEKGDLLVEFEAPPLNKQIEKIRTDIRILQREIAVMSQREEERPFIAAKQAQIEAYQERLLAMLGVRDELTVTADVSGDVHAWFKGLRPGLTLPQNTIVGKIANIEDLEVICFVPEVDIQIMKTGDAVRFRIPSTNDIVSGTILRVNPIREITLKQWQLASTYAGDLPVTQDDKTGRLRMVESYYIVQVKIDKGSTQVRFGQTGYVEVDGPWRSRLMGLLRWVLKIFWRESAI